MNVIGIILVIVMPLVGVYISIAHENKLYDELETIRYDAYYRGYADGKRDSDANR